MADSHDPDTEQQEVANPKHARYGLILFFIYLALYAAFMLLTTFAPGLMEDELFGGVSLAVIYGFGLIVIALVLALLYAWLCRSSLPTTDKEQSR